MLKKGEYAFVTIDFGFTGTIWRVPEEWGMSGSNVSERLTFLRENVLEGLISVSVKLPEKTEKYVNFTEDVRARLTKPPFNESVTSTWPSVSVFP